MSEFFTPSKPKVQLISLMNTQRLPEVLTTPRALDTANTRSVPLRSSDQLPATVDWMYARCVVSPTEVMVACSFRNTIGNFRKWREKSNSNDKNDR
jgi:hypothetical protein